jgi:hypothetical protein
MWENTVEWGRAQMAIWRMRIACWIPKATDTHSDCVILVAFPQQNWLQERASILRHRYTDRLVFYIFSLYSFLEEKKLGFDGHSAV